MNRKIKIIFFVILILILTLFRFIGAFKGDFVGSFIPILFFSAMLATPFTIFIKWIDECKFIEEKIKKIYNNKYLLFIIIIIITALYLDYIIFWLNRLPYVNILGYATINDRIIFLTLSGLIWYAWLTRGMRNEMVTQTELEQKPIPMMYIRNIDNYPEEERKKQWEYCIKINGNRGILETEEEFNRRYERYIIRIRNVGKGPLFNLEVNSEIFKIEKYQSQFLAPEPKGDEQSVKIIKKDGTEILGDYSGLNNAIFEISYDNVNRKNYKSNYRIINVEKQAIKYVG